ncbi:MAG TPA: outer membrane lipoprotein carrier protein LolA [Candidatus Binataceae bacterium]|nr:outer membrane lipoprotein carrier protein LolA [Candidatus Binataceae bacterium]
MRARKNQTIFRTALALVVMIGAATMVMGIAGAAVMAVAHPTTNLKSILDRLQRHYETTDSFTAKFTETLTSAGGPPRERSGKVAYRKGGRIRWEFDQPAPESVIADGATLYDYDPGLNQVIEMPLGDAFKSRSAAAFILGVANLQRDFDAQLLADAPADGLDHLVVTPKDGGDKIGLGLDAKSLNIVTLQVADALGNVTLLKFSDIRRNVPLANSLFTFTPPPGADIVTAPHQK